MRNYDLSPCCVSGLVLTNWLTPCKAPLSTRLFRRTTSKSDDNHYRITLALAGFRGTIWISSSKARV